MGLFSKNKPPVAPQAPLTGAQATTQPVAATPPQPAQSAPPAAAPQKPAKKKGGLFSFKFGGKGKKSGVSTVDTLSAADLRAQGVKAFQQFIAPSAVLVTPNSLQIGKRFCRTMFVANFPRFVRTAWLAPIINLNRMHDISIFIHPADTTAVLKGMTSQLAKIQAQVSQREEKGLVRSPVLDTALQDIERLRDSLQQGRERFFRLGIYMTVYGNSEEEVETLEKEIESILENRLIESRLATFQQQEGFNTTLPISEDRLLINSQMNTGPISTSFPFVSADLSSNKGILYGVNRHNNSLILFDRFSLENANEVVFGKSGSGKTIRGSERVLCRVNEKMQLTQIGRLVESYAKQHGTIPIDREIEGILFPPGLEIYAFDKSMRGSWSRVTVAMRKKAPDTFYKLQTQSGREITTTGDHNMVILKDGIVQDAKMSEVREGAFIPLPRVIRTQKISPFVGQNAVVKEYAFETLAGLITSEGNVTLRAIYISNTDPKVLLIINECLKTLNITKYSWSLKDEPGTNFVKVHGIYIKDRGLVARARRLGLTGTSGTKHIPSYLVDLDNQAIAAYLSAYYEGDGGVEKCSVSATTKSKDLASGLSYLLYRFGIVARIKKIKKMPTNSDWKRKKTYWRIAISGREQLERFQYLIGFLTKTKNDKLGELLAKQVAPNTNVDVIPEMKPYLQAIYDNFGFALYGINNALLCPLLRARFKPSREMLNKIISEVEFQIRCYEAEERRTAYIRSLPELREIIAVGAEHKELNRALWQQMGQTWRLMKNQEVQSHAHNVFAAARIVGIGSYSLANIKYDLEARIRNTGTRLTTFSTTTKAYIIDNPSGAVRYATLKTDIARCQRIYDQQAPAIARTKQALASLKRFVNADLFWDPIAKIQKIANKRDKYVYDLTVDNEVFLAGHGGMFVHNSYTIKLEILRYMMQGADIIIIDPENEYQYLAQTVGGSFLKISLSSEHHINPFDLPPVREGEDPRNVLREAVVDLVNITRIMLGGLSAEEDAIIDKAIREAYASRDITPETPNFHEKTPPILKDLQDILQDLEGGKSLAIKLEKYTTGRFEGFFNHQSNIEIDKELVVFNIRDMEEDLRPIAMFIILNYIWKRIRYKLKKRILFVDEAWWLLQHEESASFLFSIAKRARKYYLGLTTITQDVADFLRSRYGEPIITNSSLQLLFKQSPATIDIVQQTFNLTDEEKMILLQSSVGTGIFFAGLKHVAIQVVASYSEDQIITSDPEQILKIEQAKKELAEGNEAQQKDDE
ncbi:MAG: Type IV secretory pathway VirB4 protein-like protein [Parcubacteria group bacterium GW2011_GWA2_47_8]|nr:MAG: Type IV secretory pathway VirB4 protein-like protein [Parcubacteria group bacterium GW2011_GWA2_47_8]